jgi:hypothetical protein
MRSLQEGLALVLYCKTDMVLILKYHIIKMVTSEKKLNVIHIWTPSATWCDKVWQWLEACRWVSPGTPVSSTNKTDRHDITETP